MTSPLLEWRPIDTAPKDGTVLLLSDGVGVRPAMWDEGDERYDGLIRAGWVYWIVEITKFQPSYWMPLPAPPKAEKAP